jgi:hypothetical protein
VSVVRAIAASSWRSTSKRPTSSAAKVLRVGSRAAVAAGEDLAVVEQAADHRLDRPCDRRRQRFAGVELGLGAVAELLADTVIRSMGGVSHRVKGPILTSEQQEDLELDPAPGIGVLPQSSTRARRAARRRRGRVRRRGSRRAERNRAVTVPVDAHRVAVVPVVGFAHQRQAVADPDLRPQRAGSVVLAAGQRRTLHQDFYRTASRPCAGGASRSRARVSQGPAQGAEKASRIHSMAVVDSRRAGCSRSGSRIRCRCARPDNARQRG